MLDCNSNNNLVQGAFIWDVDNIYIDGGSYYQNGASGIQIENGVDNCVIDGATVYDNCFTGVYNTEGNIWIDDAVDVVVRNCAAYDSNMGVRISGMTRANVHHNLLYDNNGGAGHKVLVRTLHVHDPETDTIYMTHNTLYNNGHANSSAVGTYHAEEAGTTMPDITFVNNIVSDSLTGEDLLIGAVSSYVSDYNNVYNSTRAISVEWSGTSYTWANYKSTSSQDANSVTGNPNFTDAVNDDFTLDTGSAALNTGRDLTTTTSASTGTVIPVVDAGFFTDGMSAGATGYKATGDSIIVGSNNAVTITSITGNNITVDTSITWGNGDAVNFAYTGSGPNMGAE
jgi:hypothetical protein